MLTLKELNSEQKANVKEMVEMVNCTQNDAKEWLKKSNWDLMTAVQHYLDSKTTAAAPSGDEELQKAIQASLSPANQVIDLTGDGFPSGVRT